MIVKVLTPEALVLSEDAMSVTLPAAKGETTIMPGHTHIIFDMNPGRMLVRTILEDGSEEDLHYQIEGGFAEVAKNGNLTVFTPHVTATES